MKRIVIFMKDEEEEALKALADRKYRDLRAQAAMIIRETLQAEGLLEAEVDTLEKENEEDERAKKD